MLIEDVFSVHKPRKTLKTRPKRESLTREELLDLILTSMKYIHSEIPNPEEHTAVEFPYGGCYFVIAKLKDRR